MVLALNNPWKLICHKNKPNQTNRYACIHKYTHIHTTYTQHIYAYGRKHIHTYYIDTLHTHSQQKRTHTHCIHIRDKYILHTHTNNTPMIQIHTRKRTHTQTIQRYTHCIHTCTRHIHIHDIYTFKNAHTLLYTLSQKTSPCNSYTHDTYIRVRIHTRNIHILHTQIDKESFHGVVAKVLACCLELSVFELQSAHSAGAVKQNGCISECPDKTQNNLMVRHTHTPTTHTHTHTYSYKHTTEKHTW